MTALLASMTVALGGCQGIQLANLVALSVTVGLFFGTLQLGRTSRPTNVDRARENANSQPAPRLNK